MAEIPTLERSDRCAKGAPDDHWGRTRDGS